MASEHQDVLDRWSRIECGPPILDQGDALEFLTEFFGSNRPIDPATLTRVPGETDANYRFHVGSTPYLLKVSHESDRNGVGLQHEVLRYLTTAGLPFATPRVVSTPSGGDSVNATVGGQEVIARVFTWLPGRPLGEVSHMSDELIDDVGAAAGALAAALARFGELSAERETRTHYWDLDAGVAVLRSRRDDNPDWTRLFDQVIEAAAPWQRSGVLPRALVHNDLNAFNLLIDTSRHRTRVSAVIDFGDAVVTSRINDLAILIASICRNSTDFVSRAARLVAAYHRFIALDDAELRALLPLITLRTATVLATTAQHAASDPRHRSSVSMEWLESLHQLDGDVVTAMFRSACGLPAPVATGEALQLLDRTAVKFLPIVEGVVAVFDRSVRSDHYDGIDLLDPQAMIAAEPAPGTTSTIMVGRYGEPRLGLGGVRRHGQESKNICLALDVAAPAGTTVRAPLDGTATVTDEGDVIVDHRDSGVPVWTRYRGIENAVSGRLRRGDSVGQTSNSAPLLAQVTTVDPQRVAVPWFCSASEFEAASQLAADASILLGPGSPVRRWSPRLPDSLAARGRNLPRTHPTYFEKPLDMVRAQGCWFFDEYGNRYLDALNNVTLLGHCHPRVTAAAVRQLGRLQTNSRFVYDALTDYTEAIVETLPDGLDVVYMLNSGSEANDLALNMARYVTGRQDVVVIEDAYHGYTTVVADVSPARFKRYGKPDTTHVVANPDRYRGAFGYDDHEAGTKYAADVIAEFDRLIAAGRRPAAFIYEALLAGGGQVVLPPNYLAPIHAAARERGILTIADEVQVGFGRLGSAFWGFQTQGPEVVPDFVTMGKSMGNGFPVAALVTTRALSERFDETGRFFSTYGGNPTACAVALEVLSVLNDEGLQENAEKTGEYLREGLWQLAQRHELIGDVRGQGFYSGVEFVTDRTTKEHASTETLIVCNRMKDDGVLVYPTGAQWNILKIKPPLSFTRDHADLFVATLDGVLTRGW
ncbi:aminotransferase class III-fold pyridoxal phosphate-dependent enzyme [Mycolicibacterium sp. CBM1]